MKTKRSAVSDQPSVRRRSIALVGVVESNWRRRASAIILIVTLPFVVLCASASAADNVGLIDSGGGSVTSASYEVVASLGAIGGDSGSGSISNRGGGRVIQPAAAKMLSLNASASSVNEGSTNQLSGIATMEDDSFTSLAGNNINWNTPTFPIAEITASGVATTVNVYADTPASFSGSYLGVTGFGSFTVLDSNPDDYGIYASDGIPDSWQVQYFGLNNPEAAPTEDADGTGQNNLFKYVAGLDPTNPASVFVLRIETLVGQPNQKALTWKPWASGRTYTSEFRTDLSAGAYAALDDYSGPQTNGTEVSVTDLNATEPAKFYRIRISYP